MKWRSLEESSAREVTRTLREEFAERRQLIAKYVPAETQAIHSKVIRDLKQSGIEQRILPVGAQAPAFELQDQDGNQISSSGLLAKGRLVVSFVRGRWCPFCVGQLERMNLILPEIRASGAHLVAISPQTVQQSSFMADQHELKFPLLSDSGNRVARQFGIVYRVPEEQQAIYRRAFVNLPFANGEDSWELPIPATYIFEPDGRALFASADADYSQRPEPADVLAYLGGSR